jgi:hypothetical protein
MQKKKDAHAWAVATRTKVSESKEHTLGRTKQRDSVKRINPLLSTDATEQVGTE